MGPRILIIKLAALGDVLRTTPIVPALRKVYPDAHITWVTQPEVLPLLARNSQLNRVLPLDFPSWIVLWAEEFDLILSLDKDAPAASLAVSLKGKVKRGFGWNAQGSLYPLDEKAEYAYKLGIDNELKFRINQKTYQQITFELCELVYAGEEYQWETTPEETEYARLWAKGSGLDRRRPTIGLNTGWGEKFAGKGWRQEHWGNLINRLGDHDANIILLGGPREIQLNGDLFRQYRWRGSLHNSGTNNALGQFGAIVDLCDLVVTGDTFGMHVAIAKKKKVVALFGSTCQQEIDLYGRGIKLFPTDLPCSPCYKKVCDFSSHEECLKRISVDQVFNGIHGLLPLQVLRKDQQAALRARQQAAESSEHASPRFSGTEDDDMETKAGSISREAGAQTGPGQGQRHERRRERGGRWRRFRGRSSQSQRNGAGFAPSTNPPQRPPG